MSGTVLLLGIPSEPPLALAAAALRQVDVPFVLWDQRQVSDSTCEVLVDDSGMTGILSCPSWTLPLEEVVGVYTRLASWMALPSIENLAYDDPVVRHTAAVHSALDTWVEATTARVVNRTFANESNNSKPYQSLLIRRYFHIPETLVTNEPDAAIEFCSHYARTIYKSISGERSIVTEFGPDDRDRLRLLPSSPIQLQAWVNGFEVRVHVVDNQVFATRITSTCIDYRYDDSTDGAEFTAFEMPIDVEDACLQLTKEMQLGLAGLDLKFASDGRVFCFEVNPSPAYSVFESATGQRISQALADYLSGV